VLYLKDHWKPEKVTPAYAFYCDMPGSSERAFVEHLHATLPQADISLPYHEKRNAVKHLIVAAFEMNEIPQQFNITLPLFCGNHTTMGQHMRYNRMKEENKELQDKDMEKSDYMRWVAMNVACHESRCPLTPFHSSIGKESSFSNQSFLSVLHGALGSWTTEMGRRLCTTRILQRAT
jgi:hypothetical protein